MSKSKPEYLDSKYWPTNEDGKVTEGFYEQDGKLVAVLRVGQKLQAAEASEREWRINRAHEAMHRNEEIVDCPVQGRGEITLKVHAMAAEFPVTELGIFARMVEDVEQRGFDNPIDLTPEDEILDGRTRAWVAWVTGIEVPVRPFEGTAEEATSKAVAGNLLRRHLTTVAQAALALKYLAPALTAEAAKRQREGKKVEGSSRVADELAVRSNGAFSASTVKRIKGVESAPATFARVIDGELTSAKEISEAMEDEIRSTLTPAQKAQRTKAQRSSGRSTVRLAEPADKVMDRFDADLDKLEAAIDAERLGTLTAAKLDVRVRKVMERLAELIGEDAPDAAAS